MRRPTMIVSHDGKTHYEKTHYDSVTIAEDSIKLIEHFI